MMSEKRKYVDFKEDVNTQELLSCKYCSFGTNNIDDLDEHVQLHEDTLNIAEEEEKLKKIEEEIDNTRKEVKYEIEQYEKTANLKRKPVKVKDDVWYNCGLCPYKTKRKSDLHKHFITHSTLETTTVYRCSECNYETKRKNDMPKHMLGHCTDGVPMYKCPDCPYQTKRKNDLPKHLLCHKPPESLTLWYCAHCSYCTKRKGDLHKHELNHLSKDQLKIYPCTECNYVTKRNNDLHKHMLVHCDRHIEGVFKCLKCSYASDKVHKFSKHVLSNCTYWKDPKNLDEINLEEILDNADNDGIHVVINDEDQCYFRTEEEPEENSDDESTEEYEDADMDDEAYEIIEEGETQQYEESQDEYLNNDGQYVDQQNQYEYVNESNFEDTNTTSVEHNTLGTKKAIFNLNLGEFTIDDEAISHQEYVQSETQS